MNSDPHERNFHTRDLTRSRADLLPDRGTRPLDHQIPTIIQLRVPETNSIIKVPAREYIIIGRRENPGIGEADVDLTPYGGAELGVSRVHVVVSVRGTGVTVKDYNSTNGTFINNFALKPLHAYRLWDGDELRLGRLALQVSFLAVPAQSP